MSARQTWRGLLALQAGTFDSVLDAAKGYAAVLVAGRLATGANSLHWMIAAAMAAVIGHMFPVWLKFQGGKGVATSLGAFLPICREAVIAAVILWIVVVAFWRYSSLGSIVSARGISGIRLPALCAGPCATRIHYLGNDLRHRACADEALRKYGTVDRRGRASPPPSQEITCQGSFSVCVAAIDYSREGRRERKALCADCEWRS